MIDILHSIRKELKVSSQEGLHKIKEIYKILFDSDGNTCSSIQFFKGYFIMENLLRSFILTARQKKVFSDRDLKALQEVLILAIREASDIPLTHDRVKAAEEVE